MWWNRGGKANSWRKSNQDTWLVHPVNVLPLSYDKRVANHQPSQFSTCTEMPQLHTQQLLTICRQNSSRGWAENYFHQERTHAMCFLIVSTTLCSTYLCRIASCPVVITQWQSTGCTSHVSWVRFSANASLSLSSVFASKHQTCVSFQHEMRVPNPCPTTLLPLLQ